MAKKHKEEPEAVKAQEEAVEELKEKKEDHVLPDSDSDLSALVASFTELDKQRLSVALKLELSRAPAPEVPADKVLVDKEQLFRLVRAVIQVKTRAYEGSAGLGRVAKLIGKEGYTAGREFYQEAQKFLAKVERGVE